MAEFDLSLNVGGERFTARGRRLDRAYPDTPFACEPQTFQYKWKVRVVNETTGMVAMYRPMIGVDGFATQVASKTLDAIANGALHWSRLIPADDPRLQ